jgi:hypothetical protein
MLTLRRARSLRLPHSTCSAACAGLCAVPACSAAPTALRRRGNRSDFSRAKGTDLAQLWVASGEPVQRENAHPLQLTALDANERQQVGVAWIQQLADVSVLRWRCRGLYAKVEPARMRMKITLLVARQTSARSRMPAP